MKETRKVCYNMILFNSLLSFACYFGVDLFLYRSDFLYAFGLSLLLVSLPLFFGSFANVGVGENNAVSGRIKCVQHSEKFS